MDKKVSVIMSTYNNKNTIERAIESILSQTYKNFEFIICDDASTDGTYEILKKFQSMDNRIKVIRNLENKGGAYSKNRCISEASGEYIAGQDGDDYSCEDRIEKQVEFLNKNDKYAIVFTRAYLFDDNGVWGERGLSNYSPDKYDLIKSNQFIHPTMMCRKVCLDEVNGYTYSELTLRCEDYDLWFKLYANGLKGYVMDDKLYYFREDKESYTRKKFRYRLDEMRLRVNGCRIMGVSKRYYIYALKPLVAGMVPKVLLRCYHRIKYSKL